LVVHAVGTPPEPYGPLGGIGGGLAPARGDHLLPGLMLGLDEVGLVLLPGIKDLERTDPLVIHLVLEVALQVANGLNELEMTGHGS